MRWSGMLIVTLMSAAASAQTPPLVLGHGDFDGDGKQDTVERATLAPIAGSFAVGGPALEHPELAAPGNRIASLPDATGVIVRLASDPEHPYLVVAASRAKMMEGLQIEVKPPGRFAVEGKTQSIDVVTDSIQFPEKSAFPNMLKVWDAKWHTFAGYTLAAR